MQSTVNQCFIGSLIAVIYQSNYVSQKREQTPGLSMQIQKQCLRDPSLDELSEQTLVLLKREIEIRQKQSGTV